VQQTLGEAEGSGQRTVGVALSGGGVRAMLYGLGALRAVVAGLGPAWRLTDLASVSGGSIGAAYALPHLEPPNLAAYDRNVLEPAIRTMTNRSLMWCTPRVWGVLALLMLLSGLAAGLALGGTRIWGAVLPAVAAAWLFADDRYFDPRRRHAFYAAVLALVAGGFALIGSSADLSGWWRAGGTLATLVAVVIVFGWRGAAIEHGMMRALFPAQQTLAAVPRAPRLALTATNLDSGEPLYLTPDALISWRWGTAAPGALPLVRAVRASATFPGVFPALHLPHLIFSGKERAPDRLALVDGGVYDNMGTEWFLGRRRDGTRRWQGDYLVVVNASRNLPPVRGGFGAFGLGELKVIMREQSIQFDAATAPRRRWLLDLFKQRDPAGTIVRIDKNLHLWVSQFVAGNAHDARGARARAVHAKMDATPDAGIWKRWADDNGAIGTHLDLMPRDQALDLVRAGYLSTAVQLHILEDWPEPERYDPATLFDPTSEAAR